MPTEIFTPNWMKEANGKMVKTGSIIKLNANEELFLSYSEALSNGPGIVRNGFGSPWMEVVEQIGKVTTDPDEQRWLTWFIDEECQKEAIRNLTEKPKATPNWSEEHWLHHVPKVHTEEFKVFYPEYLIVGQQGCGDLTMNEWNVAFINSRQTGNVPVLLHLLQEPLSQRSYTCLVKWNDKKKGVTIHENGRFTFFPKPSVEIDSIPNGNDIEFAVYGRQVIRNGAINDFGYIADQFTDVRHLFQLPNLNPKDCIQIPATSNKIQMSYMARKRIFFGDEQNDDVWLGEAQLLADRNLRRAALKNPIYLNLHYEGLAAPRAVVEAAMKEEKYQKVDIVRTPGEWRFLPKDYTKPGDWIEVFLKPNKYPCSMIGVSQDGQSVYLLAYAGGYWKSSTGKTIQEVAQDFLTLTNNDVYHALLFDEGGDVFQKAALNGHLTPLVSTSRLQLRCCFIVGKVNVEN